MESFAFNPQSAGIMRSSLYLSDLITAHEPGCLLTRPSGTLSPSEGERDGVRGRFTGSLHGFSVAHWDHEPLRLTEARSGPRVCDPQPVRFMGSQGARAHDRTAARPDKISISLSGDNEPSWHRKAALSEQHQVRAFAAAPFDFGGAAFFKLEQVFHERLLSICSFWRAITRRRTKRNRR